MHDENFRELARSLELSKGEAMAIYCRLLHDLIASIECRECRRTFVHGEMLARIDPDCPKLEVVGGAKAAIGASWRDKAA